MGEYRMPSLGADMEAGTLVEWLVQPGDVLKKGDLIAVVETDKGAVEVELFQPGTVETLLVEPGAKVPVGTPLARLGPVGEPAAGPARGAQAVWGPEADAGRAGGVGEAGRDPGYRTAPGGRVEEAVPVPERARPGGGGRPGTWGLEGVARDAVPSVEPVAPGGPGMEGAAEAAPRREDGPLGGGASPAARRRAQELGLELSAIAGSGPGGAVVLVDVERAAGVARRGEARPVPEPRREEVRPVAEPRREEARPVGRPGAEQARPVERPEPEEARPVGGPRREEARPAAVSAVNRPEEAPVDRQAAMRRAISSAMSRSNQEIPHYYLSLDIEVSALVDWLKDRNQGRGAGDQLLPIAPILKAIGRVARKYPEINGFFVDGEHQPSPEVHLGMAISLRQGGLVAPALLSVPDKPVDQVMQELEDLVTRAREGRIRSSELTSATLTVTSMGEQGVPVVLPVIFPPQTAIVGVGRITTRPWVVGDAVQPRPVATLTLGADHRVSNGHRGGLFLRAIERLLQHPEDL